MVRNALAFVGGVMLLHLTPQLPAPLPLIAILVLGVLTSAWLRNGALCACCLGLAWAGCNATLRLAADLPEHLEGVDVELRGCVATLPELSQHAVRFGFEVDTGTNRVPPFVELTWYEPEFELAPADCVSLTARLKRRRGFANPGGFDYEGHLFASGVGATGYVRSVDVSTRSAREWRYPLLQVRSLLGGRISAALLGRETTGIVTALATGDRRRMTDAQWRTFAATGTSHLMAISGLHIGIVAGLVAWLGRRLAARARIERGRHNAEDAATVAAFVGALVYAALAGFSLPTQRALAMLTIYLLARVTRRQVSAPDTLALAAVAVLLVDPFAPLSTGAWLSFGAVGAILWVTLGRPVRPGRTRTLVETQWAVTCGLLPVLAAAFGSVSLIAPLANLCAIPLFSLIVVPLVLAGTALVSLSTAAGAVLLVPAATLLDVSLLLLERLAQLPYATWTVRDPGMTGLLALGVGAWLAIGPFPWPLRGIAFITCCALLVRGPDPPAPGAVEVTVLDVGQGLAVLVRTARSTLLYDAGPAFRSGRDTGELVILPALRSMGIRRLDRVIASHGDLDHVGGLASVVAGVEVGSLYASPSVRVPDRIAEPCVRDARWTSDGVEFGFLHPSQSAVAGMTDNDASCVLEIVAGRHRVLLAGDIEAAAEDELVRSGRLAAVTLLVAPHHGSRTSSSPPFVAATRPRLVVFAVGHRNRWGFPKEDVLARWRAVGAATMTTAAAGAITVRITAEGGYTASEQRRAARRYWRAPPGV